MDGVDAVVVDASTDAHALLVATAIGPVRAMEL
jgi:hypothetical protein